MSRSRQKVPFTGAGCKSKFYKKLSNKKFRRKERNAIFVNSDSGAPLKQREVLDTWDILDYHFIHWSHCEELQKLFRK